MPLKAIDFSKTIIYKIWKDDDFYVGSTIVSFKVLSKG
jgi:hypothetical protein